MIALQLASGTKAQDPPRNPETPTPIVLLLKVSISPKLCNQKKY